MASSARSLTGALVFGAILASVPALVHSRDREGSWPAVAANALAVFVSFFAVTLAVELAGVHVRRALSVPDGEWALARKRRGPPPWTLKRDPFTSDVHVTWAPPKWPLARLVASDLARPVVALAIFATAASLTPRGVTTADLGRQLQSAAAFAFASAVFMCLTLVRVARRLFQLPSEYRERAEELSFAPLISHAASLLAAGNVRDATALVESAHARAPSCLYVRLARSNLFVALEQWGEAIAELRLVLGEPRARTEFSRLSALSKNNLAWAAFMLDDPALLDDADCLSQSALAALPKVPSLHGTRGAILLLRGALEEAEAHLEFAFAHNAPKSRALNACCLAMVHARRGDRAAAERWLNDARMLDGDCSLLGRAEAEVTSPA